MTINHYFNELDVSKALCAETDPELFFPDKGLNSYGHLAKRICEQCEIRLDCLEVALRREYTDGIWGGTTPRERANLMNRGYNRGRVSKRKLTITPKGTNDEDKA